MTNGVVRVWTTPFLVPGKLDLSSEGGTRYIDDALASAWNPKLPQAPEIECVESYPKRSHPPARALGGARTPLTQELNHPCSRRSPRCSPRCCSASEFPSSP